MENLTWIDPTLGYPNPALREGVEQIERQYVAVSIRGFHKLLPNGSKVGHTKGLEHVDDRDWELFVVSKRGIIDGQSFVWGMFVEGLGMVDYMIEAENVRHLSEAERKHFSGMRMGMYGSHSGNLSYTFTLGDM